MLNLIKSMLKSIKMKIRKAKAPGIMNASSSYMCPECGKTSTRQEWSSAWDWGGPHCPKCGASGMGVFSSVVEQDCPKGIRIRGRG